MENIKRKDRKIAVKLRKALYNTGYNIEKNYIKLPRKPNLVLFKKYRNRLLSI